MTDKKITMYQLEQNLIDELNDNKKEILEHEYGMDLIHEYVDSNVPVYNYDRLQLACDDLWLGYPSENGLSDGCDNAYDIIAANIYEKLSEVGCEWYDKNKKEVA